MHDAITIYVTNNKNVSLMAWST